MKISEKIEKLIQENLNSQIIEEVSCTNALDRTLTGFRTFQVLCCSIYDWGVINLYSENLKINDITKFCNVEANNKLPKQIQLLALDSILSQKSSLSKYKNYEYKTEGTLREKSNFRHNLIFEEISNLINSSGNTKVKNYSIRMYGYFHEFVEMFRTEFNEFSIIDSNLNISDENEASENSICVISGSSLVEDSLEFTICKEIKNKSKIIILAETAPSVYPFLGLENKIDVLICECFPFFYFPGLSEYKVYRYYE